MTTLAGKLLPIFRENVETHLVKRGWTRADLAEQMEVTRSYVTQILGGHRGVGLDALESVADALNVPAADLIKVKKRLQKAS